MYAVIEISGNLINRVFFTETPNHASWIADQMWQQNKAGFDLDEDEIAIFGGDTQDPVDGLPKRHDLLPAEYTLYTDDDTEYSPLPEPDRDLESIDEYFANDEEE